MRLELLTEKYRGQIREIANDFEVSKTSSVDFPCTPEIVEGWLAKNRAPVAEELYFALLQDEQAVGGGALKYLDWEERSAYLGYWIGRPFWGRGLGYGAGRLLRDYAFETLELNLLHAMCLQSNNDRSKRILVKIGFELDTARDAKTTMGRWGEAFPGDAWGFYLLPRERWQSLQDHAPK